jgi:hypothetical protein
LGCLPEKIKLVPISSSSKALNVLNLARELVAKDSFDKLGFACEARQHYLEIGLNKHLVELLYQLTLPIFENRSAPWRPNVAESAPCRIRDPSQVAIRQVLKHRSAIFSPLLPPITIMFSVHYS